MFFSKSAITLLSSIGASSIPVVSVIVLYQIKHFSLGNNLESSSTASSSEENVISLPQTIPQTVPQTIPPAQEPQKPEVKEAQQSQTSTTPKVTESSEPKSKKTQNKSSTSQEKNPPSSDAVITHSSILKNDDSEEKIKDVIEVVKVIASFKKTAEKLDNTDNGTNDPKQNTDDDSDIAQKIDVFINSLTKTSSSISDATEQANIQEIIESLNKLKSKISTKN